MVILSEAKDCNLGTAALRVRARTALNRNCL